jgi:hypothetical protein
MQVSLATFAQLKTFLIKTFSSAGMIPSPPPRNNARYHPQNHNMADIARLHLHRMGRAYSHEGVIESSINDIEIFYPGDDGELLLTTINCELI